MQEERKSTEVEKVEGENNSNQAKEVTILRRNLRLLKRMILGKNKPPFFLRMMCVINFVWSSLMVFYYGFLALVISIKGPAIKGGYFDDLIAYGAKMYLVLVVLHLFALLGAVLMYRQKRIGFYIYSFAVILMPLYMLVNVTYNEVLIMFASSGIMVGLFALNYKTLGLNFKSSEKNEE